MALVLEQFNYHAHRVMAACTKEQHSTDSLKGLHKKFSLIDEEM